MKLPVFVIAGTLVASMGTPVAAQVNCEAARCAVQAALNDPTTGCPCDGAFANHGRYVSCVAHVVSVT